LLGIGLPQLLLRLVQGGHILDKPDRAHIGLVRIECSAEDAQLQHLAIGQMPDHMRTRCAVPKMRIGFPAEATVVFLVVEQDSGRNAGHAVVREPEQGFELTVVPQNRSLAHIEHGHGSAAE
jgi:hypothetical protein